MIAIAPHAKGCVLPVRAQPGARKNGLAGAHGGALKVLVTAPPQDGKANHAILELLREALDLKRSQLDLLKGATSRDKLILVRGLTPAELQTRVAAEL